MSNLDIPDGLQPLKPFIQRANEVRSRNQIVAYYCRTYAAQLGIDIIQRPNVTKDQTNFVLRLMDELEQEKEELKPVQEEGRAIMELFALKMFGKAEQALENGRCDKILAKIFYTSSILMEACKQFGELAEDLQKKQKYARWRAAQITKAVNSGEPLDLSASGDRQGSDEDNMHDAAPSNPFQQNRAPQTNFSAMDTTNDDDDFARLQQQFNQQHSFSNPNPPQTYAPLSSSIHSNSSGGSVSPSGSGMGFGGQFSPSTDYNYEFQPPKSLPPIPPADAKTPSPQQFQAPQQFQQPPPQQQPKKTYSNTYNTTSNGGGSGSNYQPQQNDLTDEDIEEAQKLTKYAISALQFYDVPVAIQNLKDALARLGGL